MTEQEEREVLSNLDIVSKEVSKYPEKYREELIAIGNECLVEAFIRYQESSKKNNFRVCSQSRVKSDILKAYKAIIKYDYYESYYDLENVNKHFISEGYVNRMLKKECMEYVIETAKGKLGKRNAEIFLKAYGIETRVHSKKELAKEYNLSLLRISKIIDNSLKKMSWQMRKYFM